MAAGVASYQGDEVLAKLLAAAGNAMNVGALRDLLAGVLAAPEGEDPDAWMVLAAADPTDDLRAQLGALKHELAAAGGGAVPDHAGRLAALRAELAGRGLAGFAVPHADEHQGEYIPLRAERLNWLTGFTGSAGMAVVLADQAAVFVDGRYTLQVRDQVDGTLFTLGGRDGKDSSAIFGEWGCFWQWGTITDLYLGQYTQEPVLGRLRGFCPDCDASVRCRSQCDR